MPFAACLYGRIEGFGYFGNHPDNSRGVPCGLLHGLTHGRRLPQGAQLDPYCGCACFQFPLWCLVLCLNSGNLLNRDHSIIQTGKSQLMEALAESGYQVQSTLVIPNPPSMIVGELLVLFGITWVKNSGCASSS